LSGGVQLAYGKKISRPDRPELMRSERDDSLRMARRGDEFNFHRFRRIDLYDRSNVSTLQPMAWQIFSNHYGVERLE